MSEYVKKEDVVQLIEKAVKVYYSDNMTRGQVAQSTADQMRASMLSRLFTMKGKKINDQKEKRK